MVSIRQIKAARALLGWSQGTLAERSGVSHPTVKRLEAADGSVGGRESTAEKMQTALESAGIIFVADGAATESGGEGVRLCKNTIEM